MAKKKEPTKGQYRYLQPMESNPDLYQFQVKGLNGKWHTITNLSASTDEGRRNFAQKTADRWVKK